MSMTDKIELPKLGTIPINNGRLSLKNEDELKNLLQSIETNRMTRGYSSLSDYNEILASTDISIQNENFNSLYNIYKQAMDDAENYCDTEEGYYAFKEKYSSLYFPEQPDDYSAYLPVSESNVALLLNKDGEIEIGGEIKQMKDITSYQQIVDLGLVPTEQTYTHKSYESN